MDSPDFSKNPPVLSPPGFPFTSSSLWIVCASYPVASVIQLCRTSVGAAEEECSILALEKLDHCIDRRSLSVPGPPVRIRSPCLIDSITALCCSGSFYLFLFFHSSPVFFSINLPASAINIKIVEHFCRIQFHIIIMCRIDNHFSVFSLSSRSSAPCQIHNILFNIFYFNSKQNLCPCVSNSSGR